MGAKQNSIEQQSHKQDKRTQISRATTYETGSQKEKKTTAQALETPATKKPTASEATAQETTTLESAASETTVLKATLSEIVFKLATSCQHQQKLTTEYSQY